jgi:hypothetical protein
MEPSQYFVSKLNQKHSKVDEANVDTSNFVE